MKGQSQNRKYAKITLEVRRKLLDLVHEQGLTFKKAADILRINQSTARMIVRKYESQGSLFQKKSEKAIRVEVQRAIRDYEVQQNKVESSLIQKEETVKTNPNIEELPIFVQFLLSTNKVLQTE